MSIIIGTDVELTIGEELYVWDKDMKEPIKAKFNMYAIRGGVFATTSSGVTAHFCNYSLEEPSYEMIKLTTIDKNPYKELKG